MKKNGKGSIPSPTNTISTNTKNIDHDANGTQEDSNENEIISVTSPKSAHQGKVKPIENDQPESSAPEVTEYYSESFEKEDNLTAPDDPIIIDSRKSSEFSEVDTGGHLRESAISPQSMVNKENALSNNSDGTAEQKVEDDLYTDDIYNIEEFDAKDSDTQNSLEGHDEKAAETVTTNSAHPEISTYEPMSQTDLETLLTAFAHIAYYTRCCEFTR